MGKKGRSFLEIALSSSVLLKFSFHSYLFPAHDDMDNFREI